MARRNSTATAQGVVNGQGRRTKRPTSKTGKGSKGTKDVVRPIGRPSALTPNTEATILGYLMQGASISSSCALAGISQPTFYRWMERGQDARETLDATGSLPETEEMYRDFRESVLDAQAQAEMTAVGVVFTAMRGGIVTSRRPVTNVDGTPQYDSNTGQVLYEESVTPPDGRLAMQYLQRARPKDWSQAAANVHVTAEVSGPGGGPVQIESNTQQITDLQARLMQVRQEMAEDERILQAPTGGDGAHQVTSMGDDV